MRGEEESADMIRRRQEVASSIFTSATAAVELILEELMSDYVFRG